MLLKLNKNQKGLTLIELLGALALIGVIGVVVTMATHQVIFGTARSTNHNTAINQVRNAGYWIEKDAQMSLPSKIEVNNNAEDPQFIHLEWKRWESGDWHWYTIDYTLEDMSGTGLKKLKRDYDGQQTLIAQYIKPKESGVTECYWDGETLKVKISAKVGNKMEERTFEVKPRPSES